MVDPLTGAIMGALPEDSGGAVQADVDLIQRDMPTPEVERSASVSKWQDRVLRAREYWEREAFETMRKNMRLARGDQWSDAANPPSNSGAPAITVDVLNDDPGARYVANVILRHIHARTASIYGKNPKFVARRKKRLLNKVWDGNFGTLQQALQALMASAASPMDPNTMAAAVDAMAVVNEAQQTIQQNQQLDRIAETLELLFEREIDEQPVPFKVQMKGTVRRALTTGVGYVKIGYPDYLVEPGAPDVKLERFFPWFPFVTNEVYDERTIFPPSDVTLIRDMQLEINRARQGLREHRRAARPKTVARHGTLEDEDKTKITRSKAHEVIELKGLPEGMRVEDALMAFPGPQIDPNLYETSSAYEDILRVVGVQEANLGGTSGATATESSIAEGSRMSSVSSIIDDLDEFLTELARASGMVLFSEMPPERVAEVVGPGAVWPELSREQIAREISLDVEAASTGRPNKQQEIQNATQMMPLLLQIPGLSVEWLAREMLRRLDDRVDLTDAFAAGMPSVQMLNQAKQLTAGAGEPASDPNAQGDSGGRNAPSTEPPQQNVAPRAPEPAAMGAPAGLG